MSTECVHHWLLPTPEPGPAGSRIPGRCRHCGITRVFNRAPEPQQRFNPALGARAARSRGAA